MIFKQVLDKIKDSNMNIGKLIEKTKKSGIIPGVTIENLEGELQTIPEGNSTYTCDLSPIDFKEELYLNGILIYKGGEEVSVVELDLKNEEVKEEDTEVVVLPKSKYGDFPDMTDFKSDDLYTCPGNEWIEPKPVNILYHIKYEGKDRFVTSNGNMVDKVEKVEPKKTNKYI